MEDRVKSPCEGWWNRSDISPELKREIPAGTESRGGIREEGQNGERCDSLGVKLFCDRLLLTHTTVHILRFSVSELGDALIQRGKSAWVIKINITLLASAFVCVYASVVLTCMCSCVSIITSVQMYIFVVFGFALGLSRANEWNGRISPIFHIRALCNAHRIDKTHIFLPRIMIIDKWCEEIEASRFYFFKYSFQKLWLASTYSHYSWFIFSPKLFLKGTPTLQDRAICLEMNNECQSAPLL